jgi:hypothetical protein
MKRHQKKLAKTITWNRADIIASIRTIARPVSVDNCPVMEIIRKVHFKNALTKRLPWHNNSKRKKLH